MHLQHSHGNNRAWRLDDRKDQEWIQLASSTSHMHHPTKCLVQHIIKPALPQVVRQGLAEGQINKGTKVHFNVAAPEMKSCTSLAYPGKGPVAALVDHLTPDNHTHIVAFGPSAPAEMTLEGNVFSRLKGH